MTESESKDINELSSLKQQYADLYGIKPRGRYSNDPKWLQKKIDEVGSDTVAASKAVSESLESAVSTAGRVHGDNDNEINEKLDKLTSLVDTLIEENKGKDEENSRVKLIIDEKEDTAEKDTIPDTIFIVPYRDRQPQRVAFMKIMPAILEDLNCKVLFIHQRDRRPFNRGAMKNLGFIFVKNLYPEHYKNITLVFHDIDVMPWYKNQFSYTTRRNIINHFYGFPHALGGIFAIKGCDFEDINGFPNIWTWGLEDNVLQKRVGLKNKRIIRPEFIHIEKNNKNIIGLWHGWDRLINPHIEEKGWRDTGRDGIRSLYNINMKVEKFTELFLEVNITSFETGESLNSPFVRGARIMNSRENVRLNKPLRQVKRKIGDRNANRKKQGFGSMGF